MKINKIIAESGPIALECNGGRCPAFYLTDEGTVVIQGAIVTPDDQAGIDIPSGETVVSMPISTLQALIKHLNHEQ